jgi:CRISPR/Cas system CSM-associated protein Csm3 (group 7 of RAMP superfamily)
MSSTPTRGLRFALARVTIEFETALTIGTGTGDDLVDSACVVDANGLPTLPATSITGVLRQAYAARHSGGVRARGSAERKNPPLKVEALFGYQLRDAGESSRLEVSWGQVHDSHNKPVPLRAPAGRFNANDPVLRAIEAGVVRDHVRINDLGVADDGGKFDELLVPAGTRFTFELLVHQGRADLSAKAELDELVGLLNDPNVRLGGRTRRGYGVFKVVSAEGRHFDLSKSSDREAFLKLPREISSPVDKQKVGLVRIEPATKKASSCHRLMIVPQDHFLFGTGVAVRDEHRTSQKKGEEAKAHDKVPVTERRISWVGDVGRVTAEEQAEVLVPGSAIKGALKHRALFHARRKAGIWATVDPKENRPFNEASDDMKAVDRHRKPDESDAAVEIINEMFGSIKTSKDASSESARAGTGMPGRLYISDLYLSPKSAPSAPVQHVSLDRFTQGPMDGLLFSEAPISGGPPLELKMQLEPPRERATPQWRAAVDALNAALADLAEGRLALGAGSNKGFGYFSAKTVAFDPKTGELR